MSFERDVDNTRFSPEALGTLGVIEAFRGRYVAGALMSQGRLAVLKGRTRVMSVAGALRLNGIAASESLVESCLRGDETNPDVLNAILGYARAYDMIAGQAADLKISRNLILHLHRELFWFHTGSDRIQGRLRTGPLLHPPPARRQGGLVGSVATGSVSSELDILVAWLANARAEQRLNPVFQVSSFVGRFLQIAPFTRGNGRMSLLLCNLLLRQADHLYLDCLSLEAAALRQHSWVNHAMEPSPGGKPMKSADWEAVYNALAILLEIEIRNLEPELVKEAGLPADLPPISRELLSFLDGSSPQQISQIVEQTGINRNTAKLHLRWLTAKGLVTRFGSGRGTFYLKAQLHRG